MKFWNIYYFVEGNLVNDDILVGNKIIIHWNIFYYEIKCRGKSDQKSIVKNKQGFLTCHSTVTLGSVRDYFSC